MRSDNLYKDFSAGRQVESDVLSDLVSATSDLVKELSRDNDLRQITPEMIKECAKKVLKDFILRELSDGEDPSLLVNEETLLKRIVSRLNGLGDLESLLEDDTIENIDINGCDNVFITKFNGIKQKIPPVAKSDAELIEIVKRAASRVGINERRFDSANPELDLRLPDGSRLSALMGVCSRPCVSIRKHRYVDVTLEDEVRLGLCDEACAEFLSRATRGGLNILIAGRTNSGKTTLLRALINEIPPTERIITIEQSLELGIDTLVEKHPDCVALEARLANTEGVGEISMADLVRRSLRMNPDRVIVGETLGPEIVTLLNAMSQGLGSLATIHADSPNAVFPRIASYAVQAPERLSLEASNLLIATAVDLVVFVTMSYGPTIRNGHSKISRYISSIREVVGAESNMVISNEIYRADGTSGSFVAPLTRSLQEKVATCLVLGDRNGIESGVLQC